MMARRTSTPTPAVTQAQLAELLPLLPALTKAMTRKSHEVPAAIKADWHRHGLAPRHMNLLVSLALGGPMSVSDLSARLEVGLVVRSEDQTDRRRTIVDLAPAHRQAISAFVGRRAAILKEALEPLTPQERAGLVKGLRAIVSGLDSTLPQDDARK